MLEGSYFSSLTPMTNIGASGDGADTTTRLAPAWMWACGWDKLKCCVCALLVMCVWVCAFFASTYAGLFQGEEDSGGFNHILGSSFAPGDLSWLHAGFRRIKGEFQQNWGGRNISVAVTAGRKHDRNIPLINADGVAIDHQFAILSTDFTLETAVSGIIFKHVDLKRSEDDRFRISWSFQCNHITFLFGNVIFQADSSIIWILNTTVILLTMYSRSMKGSLIATTLMFFSMQALKTKRPIRPKLEQEERQNIITLGTWWQTSTGCPTGPVTSHKCKECDFSQKQLNNVMQYIFF